METRTYNFSSITMADLQGIVDIHLRIDDPKFAEWFGFSYVLQENEILFLEKLIQKHRLWLPYYQEDTLKVKFIGVILNEVDFMQGQIKDWYHANLSGKLNGVDFNGFTDYMVAKGEKNPQKPYFFIQEFKPSQTDKDVEDQLIAAMLVALEKNQKTILHGSYIIGQNWKFVILEKRGENKFQYFVSEQLDSLKIEELKQIYINLQAVKQKYCVD